MRIYPSCPAICTTCCFREILAEGCCLVNITCSACPFQRFSVLLVHSCIPIQLLSSDFECTKFHRSQAKLFKSEIVNKSSSEVRQGTRTAFVERHLEILQSRVRRQYWAMLLPRQKFLELFERQTRLDGQVSEITLSTAGANLEECQISECEIWKNQTTLNILQDSVAISIWNDFWDELPWQLCPLSRLRIW